MFRKYNSNAVTNSNDDNIVKLDDNLRNAEKILTRLE